MVVLDAVNNLERAFMAVLLLFVYTGLIALLICGILRNKSKITISLHIFITAVVTANLILLVEAQRSISSGEPCSLSASWVMGLPATLQATFIATLIIYGAICVNNELEGKRTRISVDSVRESIDNLPRGISFSAKNGMPLLANRLMHKLSEELTGHHFRNSEELWLELVSFKGEEHIESDIKFIEANEYPTFLLADGTVWRFSRNSFYHAKEKYIQIVATDITKIYELAIELKKSNDVLSSQYERLKKLTKEMAKIKREEEVLASKIEIHSELGHCILIGNLHNRKNGDRDEDILAVFDLWSKVIGKLEGNIVLENEQRDDILKQLNDAADALGCKIKVDGELPEGEETLYFLTTAIREALINAVRHGEADEVDVKLLYDENVLNVEISDNGKAVNDEIVEGGGLGTLRKKIENAGGKMQIICDQGVKLLLALDITEAEEKAWSM
jgi:hypothetical protein